MAKTEAMQTVEVNVAKLDNGLYVLTFDGAMRGDCTKFEHREARIAAASWDGKESGDWINGEWVPFKYVCPWGRSAATDTDASAEG